MLFHTIFGKKSHKNRLSGVLGYGKLFFGFLLVLRFTVVVILRFTAAMRIYETTKDNKTPHNEFWVRRIHFW